jgi:hypothetical protein
MPTRLDTFLTLPSQARHDWPQLLNGDIWQLRRGEDFNGKAKTFVQNARSQAKRRGATIRTRLVDEETVVLQFRDAAE